MDGTLKMEAISITPNFKNTPAESLKAAGKMTGSLARSSSEFEKEYM
jgi:hypothetical protein